MRVTFGKSEGNTDEDRRRLSPRTVQTQCTSALFGEIMLTRMSKVAQGTDKLTFSSRILEVESFVSTDVILAIVISAHSGVATREAVLTRQANSELPQPLFRP
jgi:hypothetical protein